MESVSTENNQLELPYKPSSVSVYWKKITIPKGLPLLLETFVRETIRENPDDIYKFLSGLSESLLAKRSEEEKAESASSTVDEPGTAVSSSTHVKQVDEESPLLDSQAPRPTTYKTEPEGEQPVEVVVIPTASSLSPSSPQQEDVPATAPKLGEPEPSNVADLLPLEVAAVTTLQAGYRGYKTRKDLKEKRQKQKELAESSSSKNENDVEESSLTPQIDSSTAEENAAASKLQAGFRGFQTRKALKEQNETGKSASAAVDDANDENVISERSETTVEQPTAEEVAAATKLQAGFRGFQTRKALKGETDLTPPSSRPGSPAVTSQLESQHGESELQKSPSAPTIPENEELADQTTPVPDPVSESPFTTSTTAEEANDEEIAAEIKTPLETIREESFDRSQSACNAVLPPPPGVIAEKGRSETPPTPLETDLGHKVEDLLLITSKSHLPPPEEKNVNVHVVSTEDISAALGGLLDDTEESSDGSDPSLRDTDVTKDTPKADPVDDSSNNDRDNKNDELKSSSAEDVKDGSDLAPIQDCDHQHQPDPIEDGPETSNIDGVSPINELLVDTPNPQESEGSSPIVHHNEGDPVEVADESKENIPQMGNEEGVESTREGGISEQPQEAINLSPSENVGEGSDQICGDDDKDDKNKRSESSSQPVEDDGDGKAEIKREMNVEENTPNIDNVASSPAPEEEVGQQAHEDDKIIDGDTDQINHGGEDVDVEKSESLQLPHSNVSPLTDSSADREDTDIATPTDFSNHEERESLNLEELKKFASNFEEEMEPTGKGEEGAAGTDVASTVPSESQPGDGKEAPVEVSSSSTEGTSSSPVGEVMQVEVKESESKAQDNSSSETEVVKPSDEATVSPQVSEDVNKESEQPEQSETPEVPLESKVENAGDKSPSDISQPVESPEVGPTEPISEANTSPVTTKQLPESGEVDPTEVKTDSDTVPEPVKESTNDENSLDAATESPETLKSSQSTTTEQPPVEANEAKPSESEEPASDGAQPPPETQPITSIQSPVPENPETESNDVPTHPVEDTEQVPVQEPTTNEQAIAQDSERAPASVGESPPKVETTPEPTKTDEASPSQEDPQPEPETPPQPSETLKSLDNPETPQESTSAPSSEPISNTTNQPEPTAAPVISNEPVESLGGPDKPATPTTTTTGSDNIDEIATKPRPQRERGNKEGDPNKSVKPTVRPRLSGANKQSRSVAIEDSAIVGEKQAVSESASSPVLRRVKSGPGRSRVATSKYRSGRVIDNQMSMDEMEKEIENEMMNNAAVKIQAGFRGFKTRKTMRSSEFGVSKKARKPEGGQEESNPSGTALASDAPASCELSASSPEPASAKRLSPEQVSGVGNAPILGESIAARGAGVTSKPPLSALRSHSFPGSHELDEMQEIVELDEGEDDPLLINPEQEIELDLDPDYINKAAVRIQKNFRGYQVRKTLKRCPSGKENNGSKGPTKSMRLSGSDKKGSNDKPKCESQDIMERLQELNNQDVEEPAQPEKAAAKIQASFRSYKERTKYQKKKKAAITLQANIRGFLTRKRLANLRRRSFQRRRSSNKAFQKELEDLRKVNDAATKIQAVFRGYQVRSKILPRSGSMISEHEQMVDE